MSGLAQVRRPWLDIYDGTGLLAQRISIALASGDGDEEDTRLPIELWLAVANSFGLSEFMAVCALARTCHTLRPLSRHPQLWEKFCRSAYCTSGHLEIESQLRCYSWSWLSMFLHRRRLRFDGLYSFATTKRIFGLNEGRGMKEADKDYYNPAGNFVTSYRVLRFFPCGSLFSCLFASQTPADIRKAASGVTPGKPRSLQQKLKGACWGVYDVHEVESAGGAPSKLGITARVLLFNESYPNMAPATVRYVLDLQQIQMEAAGRGGGKSGAFSCSGSSSSSSSSSSSAQAPAITDASSSTSAVLLEARADGRSRRSATSMVSSTKSVGASLPRTSLANNGQLVLTALAVESDTGDLESVALPPKPAVFFPFVGPLPAAQAPVPKVPLASGQY